MILTYKLLTSIILVHGLDYARVHFLEPKFSLPDGGSENSIEHVQLKPIQRK
jgi:hypothetical protein